MEELLGLDTMMAIILTGLVMGGVELIKRLFDKDWKAAITICVSAIIGGVAGAILGILPLQGAVYGLAASGYITLAQNVGKRGNNADTK